jgi:phage tail-like protein
MPTRSPIIAAPAARDPLRNFKFRVEFVGNSAIAAPFSVQAGFISVSGLGIQTDMIPYREGGDNTITRKMPGQSEVGPLQLVRGLFMLPNSPQYEWFKRVFAVNWGAGNAGFNDDFRCNAIIRVNKHPVTRWSPGDEGDPQSNRAAGLAWKVYNCWPGGLQYNDLNAGDNSIMVETMTLHHEGFEAFYGDAAMGNFA